MAQRWTINGADEQTGKLMTMTVLAPTAERAEAAARKNGILVSSVNPTAEGVPIDYAGPSSETTIDIRSVSAGAAFKFGFYGAFGAIAAWIVLWSAVALIGLVFGFTIGAILRKFYGGG